MATRDTAREAPLTESQASRLWDIPAGLGMGWTKRRPRGTNPSREEQAPSARSIEGWGAALPDQRGPTVQTVERGLGDIPTPAPGGSVQEAGRGSICRVVCQQGVQNTGPPESRWEMPQKTVEIKAGVPWDLQRQTDRQLPANQPDVVAVEKDQKAAGDGGGRGGVAK